MKANVPRKLIWTAALLPVLVISCRMVWAGDHIYVSGRLVSARVDERLHQGTSLRRVVYKVQVEDILYTLEGERVPPHTKDYTHGLIIGDPVQVSVEGAHLVLETPDGKSLETDILTRERIEPK